MNEATGKFEDNPVRYINVQLMYYLHLGKTEIESMDDETWAEHYAILANIRKEEAKQKPFNL